MVLQVKDHLVDKDVAVALHRIEEVPHQAEVGHLQEWVGEAQEDHHLKEWEEAVQDL